MEKTLHEIVAAVKRGEILLDGSASATQHNAAKLDKLVRARNREMHDGARTVAKRRLLPAYLAMRKNRPEVLESWGVDAQTDAAVVKLLKAKPRRTASGVATITVLTKPWPCSGECLFCPNDIRMPKSYMSDEPACQRAERNFFDPYLQVCSRLRVLSDMGHVTDKVELIVLGGTWDEYPAEYRQWFVWQLFEALNDAEGDTCVAQKCAARRAFYEAAGLESGAEALAARAADVQAQIDAGALTYNEAFAQLYTGAQAGQIAGAQTCTAAALESAHATNEQAKHRCVGLVMETRPDCVTPASLADMRRLGCTKVQVGIQTLNEATLRACSRRTNLENIKRACALIRLFGFKSHVHMMANLPNSTPESDMAEFADLVSNPAYMPDELKLYPCALVQSAQLTDAFNCQAWQPYSEQDLTRVLVADVFATPEHTRISRMIRDISSNDIIAGNKKTNLRQMVENEVRRQITPERPVHEMRMREIATNNVSAADLTMRVSTYKTLVSTEHFLQWVTKNDELAGFLRLSLPDAACAHQLFDAPDVAKIAGLNLAAGQAMIREVHIYGKVAAIHNPGESAQHTGLGRRLVERACEIAHAAGFEHINVISAVGTRQYYRTLDFHDNGLYMQKPLPQPRNT
jgi:elongator complex protein 3